MQATVNRRIGEYTRRNRRHAQYPVTVRATLSLIKLFHLPLTVITSQLEAKIIRKDGTIEDLGIISRRVITTAGVNFIVACHQNTAELELINFHAMGTGSTAEAIGDTALVTEVEARVSGVQSAPAGNQYRSVATITATAGRSIQEHGILSASSAGTLFDRSIFSAVALTTGDSIQFTYTVTYTAGG